MRPNPVQVELTPGAPQQPKPVKKPVVKKKTTAAKPKPKTRGEAPAPTRRSAAAAASARAVALQPAAGPPVKYPTISMRLRCDTIRGA